MRSTTYSEIASYDPEAALRLYDEAAAEMTVTPSFWRGVVIGLTIVAFMAAITVTLISAVQS